MCLAVSSFNGALLGLFYRGTNGQLPVGVTCFETKTTTHVFRGVNVFLFFPRAQRVSCVFSNCDPPPKKKKWPPPSVLPKQRSS